jgi:hypothetical protein
MIMEVFITQGQPVHTLRHHLCHRMFHQRWIAPIQKAPRQPRQQFHPSVGLAQQQTAGIAADRAAVKSCDHLARKMGFKLETGLDTLCHSESRCLLGPNCCVETQLCQSQRLFARGSMRNTG